MKEGMKPLWLVGQDSNDDDEIFGVFKSLLCEVFGEVLNERERSLTLAMGMGIHGHYLVTLVKLHWRQMLGCPVWGWLNG
jgi:hypothetical protein